MAKEKYLQECSSIWISRKLSRCFLLFRMGILRIIYDDAVKAAQI